MNPRLLIALVANCGLRYYNMIDMYKKTVSESAASRLDRGFFICYILNTRNGSDKRNSLKENRGSAKPRDIKSLNNLILNYRFMGQKARRILTG